MADEIQTLIDSLRRGQYEDPTEKIALLSAALQEQKAEAALLLSLLRAPQIPLRLAAVDASGARKEGDILQALFHLVNDADPRVRQKLAEVLRHHGDEAANQALEKLMTDAKAEVREAALSSSASRPSFRAGQEAALSGDTEWEVRLAAVNALAQQKTPQILKAVFQALISDNDDDVRRRCGELVEKRLVESPAAAEAHIPRAINLLSKAEKALKVLGAHRFPKFLAWLSSRTTVSVDPELLAKFGTDLTALAAAGSLPRAYLAEEACEMVLKLIQREPWRSVALLGPAGVGKTALVNELVHRWPKRRMAPGACCGFRPRISCPEPVIWANGKRRCGILWRRSRSHGALSCMCPI